MLEDRPYLDFVDMLVSALARAAVLTAAHHGGLTASEEIPGDSMWIPQDQRCQYWLMMVDKLLVMVNDCQKNG